MITLPNLVFSLAMGFLMSLSITLVTTWYRIGLSQDFLTQWLSVWLVAYPVAVICIPIYRPVATRTTEFFLRRPKGQLR